MKPRIYEGSFEQSQLTGSGTIYIRLRSIGPRKVESLFEEFAGDGKLYRVIIEEIKERKESSPAPIAAKREFVPV